MRRQEITKLKELAASLDIDWQEFDFEAYDYETIKRQMYQKAGQKTEEMENEQFVAWENVAEYYDDQPLEEKGFYPEGFKPNINFNQCLILQFKQRDFTFAMQLLLLTFKGNFMNRTKRVIHEKTSMRRYRILCFVGARSTTDMILEELRKHQIYPRVLRHSYLRRDFLHYYNGKILNMSKRDFKELTQKQAVRNKKKEEQLIKQLLK